MPVSLCCPGQFHLALFLSRPHSLPLHPSYFLLLSPQPSLFCVAYPRTAYLYLSSSNCSSFSMLPESRWRISIFSVIRYQNGDNPYPPPKAFWHSWRKVLLCSCSSLGWSTHTWFGRMIHVQVSWRVGLETCSLFMDFLEKAACSFYLTLPAQMEISSEPTIRSDRCTFIAKLNLDTLLMLSHWFKCTVAHSSPFSFTLASFGLYCSYCSSNFEFLFRRQEC